MYYFLRVLPLLAIFVAFSLPVLIETYQKKQQAYNFLAANKSVNQAPLLKVIKYIKTETKTLKSVLNSSADSYISIKDLTSKHGYDLEEHEVQTDDGYLLTLHRILNRKQITRKNIDVFLMHGLMDSSDCWVIQGPEKALAYLLSDEGYDVWLGNARGNKYSNAHIKLTPTQAQYWKFTWEEIGLYDLPATIDYILKNKQRKSLYYIGHSQGTTSFYVMTTMKPVYNFKIRMMFSLSPVAYMGNVKSPIARMFSPANKVFAYWLSHINIYTPSGDFFNKLLSVVCYVMPRCDNLLYLIVGDKSKFIDEPILQEIFLHFPTSSSTMQFLHYGQLVESGRFCRFDLGREGNVRAYQDVTPPDYKLGNVIAPVELFYGSSDWLADAADVRLLITKLPRVVGANYLLGYNHLDFLYANNAKETIYLKIIKRMNTNIN